MILALMGPGKFTSDLSRVCGDDPEVSDYEGDGGEFVPRMRG